MTSDYDGADAPSMVSVRSNDGDEMGIEVSRTGSATRTTAAESEPLQSRDDTWRCLRDSMTSDDILREESLWQEMLTCSVVDMSSATEAGRTVSEGTRFSGVKQESGHEFDGQYCMHVAALIWMLTTI